MPLPSLLVILPVAAAAAVGVAWWLRRQVREEALAELAEAFDERTPEALLEDVRLLGRELAGPLHGGGRGCLAMNRRILVFVAFTPRQSLVIQLHRVLSVEALGPGGRIPPLFRVTFQAENGQRDVATWRVPDAREWVDAFQGR